MLTPLDIQNKKFTSSAMGYKKNEVEEFLELVLRDYESMYKSNIDLNDKINMLNNALEHYKNIEETMQNALIVAQSASEDVRKNSEEKAKLTIENAERQAKEIVENAMRTAAEASKEAENIKRSTELFKARMIGMMTSQIESLKSSDAEYTAKTEN
ncbi:MAG: DivIVA domain-containing protein [Clostridia bacterium]|nr:DivIVA domain-containing protein [Clostridia bacterium]